MSAKAGLGQNRADIATKIDVVRLDARSPSRGEGNEKYQKAVGHGRGVGFVQARNSQARTGLGEQLATHSSRPQAASNLKPGPLPLAAAAQHDDWAIGSLHELSGKASK